MAEWSREKVNSSDLNNGNEWNKESRIALQELNAMVNAGLYTQDFAEHLADTPDTSDAGSIGTPSVTLIDNVVNGITYKKFKFSNLKGEKGDKGDTGLPGGSNPNLLINSDFKINQRGQTNYTTNGKYTVDRWMLNYGSLVVNDNGSITHTASNTWQGIIQFIEFPSRLAGKTITISANSTSNLPRNLTMSYIKSGTSTSTQIGGKSTNISGNATHDVTITIPNDITNNDKLYVILYTQTANQSVTWNWVKLEIGSVATAFSPKIYSEDLNNCQRYYQRAFIQGLASASSSSTSISIGIPIVNELRANPSINVITNPTLRGNGQTGITITLSFNQVRSNLIVLNATSQTQLSVNQVYSAVNGLIELDSEIYILN